MQIKKLVSFIWQLPQNLVGLAVKMICKATRYSTYEDAKVYSWNINGGISLGNYIFVPYKNVNPNTYQVQQYIKHEYGHCIQSKYLGPLYLFVIGIPSFIWANCFNKYRTKHNKSYYWFYTEKWADKLGGVKRDT